MKRVFVSFDFDHDEDLRTLLVNQSKWSDSPFEIKDRSIREPLTGDWKEKVKRRMNNIDLVIVICGQYTYKASGVSIELEIAKEKNKPYFLLKGRTNIVCTKPQSALYSDVMHLWKWEKLKELIEK